MSIDQIIKLVFDSGGTLGLAVFTIFFLNKVWDGRITDVKENRDARVADAQAHAAEYRALADQVTGALRENTIAMTQLVERMRPDTGRRAADKAALGTVG